ncbi:MAG: 3-deoxy-manno-octulosonate cytidylyltransferase (CMP-KDO synthetase) [Chitinophagales bacterium]|jgi:3-deoxy-manno-octulosonate cytidylyltransferase (CMP-KDO synthetase)
MSYKHIGIYAYRFDVLPELVKLPATELETIEKLEQLRWLENGYTIKIAATKHDSNSVDTPEDLEKLKRKFNL